MVAEVQEVIGAALALPEADRQTVLQQLAISLDQDPAAVGAVSDAWGAEITKRVNDILEHKVHGIAWEQVKRQADRVAANHF